MTAPAAAPLSTGSARQPRLRRPALEARLAVRRLTASARPLPDFLIVGGQRCGTTSLYRYLLEHPDVVSPLVKETQFFTFRYQHGTSYYRAHFPTARERRRPDGHALAFDATPYYLFHPLAAQRAGAVVPQARIVVLLRDPVERAYSHYKHSLRYGLETLDFPTAVRQEASRLAGEEDRMLADPTYDSAPHRSWSYAARGDYAPQLRRWFDAFGTERVLVVRSEDMFAEPATVYATVLTQLGLSPFRPAAFGVHTKSSADVPARIDPDTREFLRQRLAPGIAETESLLGRRMDWSV